MHNSTCLYSERVQLLSLRLGFPTGVENMMGWVGGASKFDGVGGDVKSIHGEHGVVLKMLSKNTCKRVHLIVKLPAIILQAYKFTKNELYHIYFSRILARF